MALTQAEVLIMKRSTQRTRLKTLKELKRPDNTKREIKMLHEILELAHQQLALINLKLDIFSLAE